MNPTSEQIKWARDWVQAQKDYAQLVGDTETVIFDVILAALKGYKEQTK